MSRLKTDAIRNTSASADALTFDTNGNTKIADNEELQFGDSADLIIKHDGSHSYIKDTGTGILSLNGDQITLHNASGSEIMLQTVEDGAVSLYHDNAKKIETIATGVNVTGGIRLGGNNADNELADYEEGTWTPTWTGVTNNASYNSWKYIKIGKMVMIWGTLIPSATTNDSTDVKSDLPFTQAANHTNGLAQTVGSISTHHVNWTKEGVTPIIQAGVGMRIQEIQDDAGLGYMVSSSVAVNDQLMITVTYEAAT